MTATLAFDVYGTLIDTHGVVAALEEMLGDDAASFSCAWRDKQLEYSFRRGLMQHYVDFETCTRQALDYVAAAFRAELGEGQKQALLDSYRRLPAFDDVAEGLAQLQEQAFRLYAFSNGRQEAVSSLLANAGIDGFFLDVVSVDDLRSFKPNPGVYSHFLRRSGATGAEAWLISANPFDVIGAVSAGMRAVWLRRSQDMVFDPWGIDPTLTLDSLSGLGERIAGFQRAG